MRTPRRRISYPQSLGERIYSIFIGPLLVLGIIFLALRLVSPVTAPQELTQISFTTLFLAGGYTLYRLALAYILALLVAIPLALFATTNPIAEKILLPTFDIIESIPILAFFPILILFFIRFNFLNGAAIFILFLSMLWNIVFTVVGGLKIIPKDIIYAAHVFKIRGWAFFSEVLLPSIFPEIITGSILALAQGWNLIIVAEVMHVYIPGGTPSQDLFGIGSILVQAAGTGHTHIFVAAIFVMVVIIAFLNFFVWQKLFHYAEQFKFE